MRAALYCRLSEEDRHKRTAEDDSESIQNQKAMLTQYAQEQGWEIYRIYSDDDYTGSDRSRPAFCQLLADAEARCFDVVVCKTQSRFTRELELVEKYLHGLFPLWGIRFVSIVDHADTDSRGNKKSRQINGLVNEWYLEDLSENIRSVLTNRRQNGLHIGSSALYGYRRDPDRKGHLLPDPEAAAVVQEVFQRYAEGCGKTAIARMLNERGVPSPLEYKYQHGLLPRPQPAPAPTLWHYATIASMLTNPMYTGTMVQGRYGSVSYKSKQNRPRPPSAWYVVPGTHQGLISPALWQQTQALLQQRSRPFSTGQIGLFAGKARCLTCGRAMRSCKSRGRHYLQCATHHVSKAACPGAFLSVAQLEATLCAELGRLLRELLPEEAMQQAQTLHRPPSPRKQWQNALAQCQSEADQCSHQLQLLYQDRLRGLLAPEDLLPPAQTLTARRDQLRQQIQTLEQQLRCCPEEPEPCSDALPHQWLHPAHLTRPMVDALIDYVAIGPRQSGSGRVPVEVHWRF